LEDWPSGKAAGC